MEHLDVIVVGAGISGISAAVHLDQACPDKTVGILERRENIGGTWDLFKYPGIRSDSDMHTLGFSFKPWRAKKAIADGPSIMSYLDETVGEYGLAEKIRFSHRVVAADWSSSDARWTLSIDEDGSSKLMSCNFLFMCSGYYNYDEAYDAQIAGIGDFGGEVVHPQFWPEDLDHSGKRVVVIGSGATAVTLVPSMAAEGAKVTMLQRSPTYVVARPDEDAVANVLRKALPESWAYRLTRFKNVAMQNYFYKQSRKAPERVRKQLLGLVKQWLPSGYDVDTHFTPRYNPWDQRLCLVPDDDLFRAIQSGKASVVTDHIEKITEQGVQLVSGEHLDADIVVCATGRELVVLGGAEFTLDGETIDLANEWTYKVMMCSNVPNMVHTFGYINASWTLRADLIATWVCRLLNQMRVTGKTTATPRIAEELSGSMSQRFWIDDFSAGYMQRVMHRFPKQGDQMPWMNPQDYRKDRKMFRDDPIEDDSLVLERAVVVAESAALQEAS